jgi:DNA invertase Pin-like site-specific DNA recombinase
MENTEPPFIALAMPGAARPAKLTKVGQHIGSGQAKIKVSIWLLTSDASQHPENQLTELRAWAERRGFEVVKVYQVQESAWKGAHQKALTQVYQDARTGRFQILLVWALDRLSREGVAATLEIIGRLGRYGVKVLSLQESWTEAEGPMQELLLSILAWVARMESNRRSERTKAGLARAVSEGNRLGRPTGSKDKKKRRQRRYFARWAK